MSGGFCTALPESPPGGRERSSWAANGHRATGGPSPSSGLPGGRRRSIPHLAIGALLVVVCALGFALTAGSVDHRHSVLVLARPVTAGQLLTSGDVTSVPVSVSGGVSTIPASQASTVAGQTAAVSLPAGTLLSRGDLGPVSLPPGQAVVAVALAPGQAPPGLAAGEHVALVRMPPTGVAAATTGDSGGSDGASGSNDGPWSGVVTGVEAVADAQGTEVVSVQLAAAQAQRVAGLPTGQIDLVLVNGQ